MDKQTSLILNAVTQSGNKNQKTVVDVNPDTDGVILREFGEQLNSLTANTFGEAVRLDKTGLDDEGGTKITPTLTLSPTLVTAASCRTTLAPYGAAVTINYSGDGKLSVEANDPGKIVGNTYMHYCPTTAVVTIRAAETSTCESVAATIKIQ